MNVLAREKVSGLTSRVLVVSTIQRSKCMHILDMIRSLIMLCTGAAHHIHTMEVFFITLPNLALLHHASESLQAIPCRFIAADYMNRIICDI